MYFLCKKPISRSKNTAGTRHTRGATALSLGPKNHRRRVTGGANKIGLYQKW